MFHLSTSSPPLSTAASSTYGRKEKEKGVSRGVRVLETSGVGSRRWRQTKENVPSWDLTQNTTKMLETALRFQVVF